MSGLSSKTAHYKQDFERKPLKKPIKPLKSCFKQEEKSRVKFLLNFKVNIVLNHPQKQAF